MRHSRKFSLAIFCLVMLAALLSCSPEDELTGGASASPSTLTITVRSENGSVLTDAAIFINGEFKGKSLSYGTQKGSRTVVLSGPSNLLEVEKAGYLPAAPLAISASGGAEQQVTIILQPKRTSLILKVEESRGRDREGSNKDISGVSVSLLRDGEKTPFLSGKTDQHGEVEFESVPDGSYTARLFKEGYFPTTKEVEVSFADRGDFSAVYLELLPLPSLEVLVKNNEDYPLSDAEIALYTKEQYHAPGAWPIGSKFTAGDGRVLFQNVDYDEAYVIVVRRQDYLAQEREIKLSLETRQLHFSLVFNID